MIVVLRPALVLFVLLSVLTGIIYPLAITGVAQAVFPHQANGSLIRRGDVVVGSELIGQDFSGDPRYFWGRPSATSPVADTAYNADKSTGSSGSNLGPTNPALIDAVKSRIDALHAADAAVGCQRATAGGVPVDLITSSGSGLDPHISPAAAEYQVPRVARARKLSEDALRELLRRHTQPRQLGVLGESVVNVLDLNLALDQMKQTEPIR
ncbi:MAG: potassium-transporting ATPase subunit KdpC [Planctomycetes bacterium]|nr:potassium-transporting ATPase subunit KdpC [Planctomycetota bacterium]